jgi:sugar phosphate isomerase/epimerase
MRAGEDGQAEARERAIEVLERAVLPAELPYARDRWPIAAAMLQFPPYAPDGRSVADAGPEFWHAALAEITGLGFDAVEVPSAWLPTYDLAPGRLSEFRAVLDALSLNLVATTVVRQSIIDPRHGPEHLATTHRALDAAAALRAPLVCLGLHEPLLPEQARATWFWTRPGPTNPDDRATWDLAVARYRELADHARELGVLISLEMYEGTYLDSADSAVRFLADIDRPNVGLNPDIGNLVRQQRAVEPWESIAVKTLPHANYWHVKNYLRLEAPDSGTVLTSPAPMASGIINYRKAVRYALSVGFRGAFVTEHYGGDGLAAGAMNRDYLRSLLP